ncbi:MAG TPA: peptidylprolyl isomerase [Pyrinomonadaceae bacterium]|jgi:cyclophilin family peptidyl-prolyl cis-trans isomerase/HEAT repeat protein|nr:peptidylprolyl isomerase [Pyrinomonadaceae bacterium]
MDRRLQCIAGAFVGLTIGCAVSAAQTSRRAQTQAAVPDATLLTIIRHEDERRWDDQLKALITSGDPKVRARAALAAGRIGDDKAVESLTDALLMDRDNAVRQMAAFALGEIESPGGAYALVTVVQDPEKPARARAIEALGKVTAAMNAAKPAPNTLDDDRLDQCKATIVNALRFELQRKPGRDRMSVLFGLTAVLRTRPDGVGSLVTKFLDDADPAIVATALNTMARLRLKDGNERVRQLLSHSDPIVRANAARVIGTAEHKEAFDALLAQALNDSDLRVRVSAIRSLGALKDPRGTTPLLNRGKGLLTKARSTKLERPAELNEILEIVTVLGNLLKNSKSAEAMGWLRDVRSLVNASAPEVEIAMARVDPEFYVTEEQKFGVGSPASDAQGLREIATIKKTQPEVNKAAEFVPSWMHDVLTCSPHTKAVSPRAKSKTDRKCLLTAVSVSPFLQAYAAYQPADLATVLIDRLRDSDVVVRSTAAELLGEQPLSETNTRALIDALPRALRDKDSDDAALAILGALAKQKSATANAAIKAALNSSNQLIRRRAVALLKTNGAGDFSERIGTVQTSNTALDYRRAMSRIGKHVTAIVITTRGSFTIQFLPEDAPLTVDNFVQLARRGYFNGQTIPRVVPNFVIQAGDPRGDQNGGPGYQIRCEINEVMFERAAVGMALSGKDTGGSQWFVTHSAQPHLDGGYTVFGNVIRGMDVVDNIVRGDMIRRVIVSER